MWLLQKISLVALCILQIVSQSADYLDKAKNSLLRGDISGAIRIYNDALSVDASRYASAYFLLGNIYSTKGNLHLAISMYTEYLKTNPSNYDDAFLSFVKCNLRLGHFAAALEHIQTAKLSDKTRLMNMKTEIKDSEKAIEKAEELSKAGNRVDEAIGILEDLRKTVTHSSSLLKKLVSLYKSRNRMNDAISAMKYLVKVSPDDSNAYHELSLGLLSVCEVGEALDYIRKCLVIDQDNKECSKSFKIQKKAKTYWSKLLENAEKKDFAAVKTSADQLEEFLLSKAFEVTCMSNKIVVLRCQAESRDIMDSSKSLKLCSTAMKIFNSDSDDYYSALLSRAHIYVHQGELQLAKNDVNAYLDRYSGDDEAKQLKTKIERLIKQAGRRNYYEILGVTKTARKPDIARAYRKLALKYHPDKQTTSDDKAKAEVKFQDINDAYEVLTDKKKRQMFDNGLDPLDQSDMEEAQREERQQSGESFFFDPGNFNFFGGGGHFTFNF